MPDTGAPYSLRYPALNDAANVPVDMQELATDVHAGLVKTVNDYKAADTALKAGLPKPPLVAQGTVVTSLVADVVKSQPVSFGKTFKTAPVVQITAQTAVPERCSGSALEITTTGFKIYMHRTSTSQTTFGWLAVGEAP